MTGPIVSEGAMKLVEWRNSNGWNQNQAAKELKIERLTYRRWETGFGLPSIINAAMLEDRTGVPMRAWAVPAKSEAA